MTTLKKLKGTLDSVFLEKTKAEKAEKTKKNKGKGKVRLKVEGENVSDISFYLSFISVFHLKLHNY